MKTAILVVVLVAVATAAPVEKTEAKTPAAPVVKTEQLLRGKRSSYGAVYSPPCAAAQTSYLAPGYGIPSLAQHSSYGYNQHAAYPGVASYGGPHYRADDQFSEDGEMMSFSDMDHMAMARSYGYDAPAAQYGGHVYGPSVSSGPAVGVFPNAHASGCNVPLLLSCSPSIVAGKIVHQQGYGGSSYGVVPASGAGAIGYRGVDERMNKEGPAVEAHHEEHDMQHHEQHMQPHHEQHMQAQEAGHMPTMHS